MSQIAQLVLDIERSQLGVTEASGENDGVMVGIYQAVVNLGRGDAWCAAFQMWALKKAGVHGWPVTGYVPNIADWCESHGILKPAPRVGAWAIYYDNIGPYHIGMVEVVNNDGTFGAIEGNESNMVRRMTRSNGEAKFGYWQDVLTWDGPTPTLPPLNKKIKLYAHDGKTSVIVDGKTVSIKGVMRNGSPVTSTELGDLELVVDYRDY